MDRAQRLEELAHEEFVAAFVLRGGHSCSCRPRYASGARSITADAGLQKAEDLGYTARARARTTTINIARARPLAALKGDYRGNHAVDAKPRRGQRFVGREVRVACCHT